MRGPRKEKQITHTHTRATPRDAKAPFPERARSDPEVHSRSLCTAAWPGAPAARSVSGARAGCRGAPKGGGDFVFDFWGKDFRAMFTLFCASPGHGVARNGSSAKNDSQFKGRHSNPCPGDPFRGHFSFLKVPPEKIANVYGYVVCFFPVCACF